MLVSDADSRNLPGPLEPPVPQDAMLEFAHHVVNRLFSIGLSLDSARSIVGKGAAGDRVAAATDEVDRLIREIRNHVFAERGQGTRAGRPANPGRMTKSIRRRPRIVRRCCKSAWRERPMHCRRVRRITPHC